jgi:hypothetical protein
MDPPTAESDEQRSVRDLDTPPSRNVRDEATRSEERCDGEVKPIRQQVAPHDHESATVQDAASKPRRQYQLYLGAHELCARHLRPGGAGPAGALSDTGACSHRPGEPYPGASHTHAHSSPETDGRASLRHPRHSLDSNRCPGTRSRSSRADQRADRRSFQRTGRTDRQSVAAAVDRCGVRADRRGRDRGPTVDADVHAFPRRDTRHGAGGWRDGNSNVDVHGREFASATSNYPGTVTALGDR